MPVCRQYFFYIAVGVFLLIGLLGSGVATTQTTPVVSLSAHKHGDSSAILAPGGGSTVALPGELVTVVVTSTGNTSVTPYLSCRHIAAHDGSEREVLARRSRRFTKEWKVVIAVDERSGSGSIRCDLSSEAGDESYTIQSPSQIRIRVQAKPAVEIRAQEGAVREGVSPAQFRVEAVDFSTGEDFSLTYRCHRRDQEDSLHEGSLSFTSEVRSRDIAVPFDRSTGDGDIICTINDGSGYRILGRAAVVYVIEDIPTASIDLSMGSGGRSVREGGSPIAFTVSLDKVAIGPLPISVSCSQYGLREAIDVSAGNTVVRAGQRAVAFTLSLPENSVQEDRGFANVTCELGVSEKYRIDEEHGSRSIQVFSKPIISITPASADPVYGANPAYFTVAAAHLSQPENVQLACDHNGSTIPISGGSRITLTAEQPSSSIEVPLSRGFGEGTVTCRIEPYPGYKIREGNDVARVDVRQPTAIPVVSLVPVTTPVPLQFTAGGDPNSGGSAEVAFRITAEVSSGVAGSEYVSVGISCGEGVRDASSGQKRVVSVPISETGYLFPISLKNITFAGTFVFCQLHEYESGTIYTLGEANTAEVEITPRPVVYLHTGTKSPIGVGDYFDVRLQTLYAQNSNVSVSWTCSLSDETVRVRRVEVDGYPVEALLRGSVAVTKNVSSERIARFEVVDLGTKPGYKTVTCAATPEDDSPVIYLQGNGREGSFPISIAPPPTISLRPAGDGTAYNGTAVRFLIDLSESISNEIVVGVDRCYYTEGSGRTVAVPEQLFPQEVSVTGTHLTDFIVNLENGELNLNATSLTCVLAPGRGYALSSPSAAITFLEKTDTRPTITIAADESTVGVGEQASFIVRGQDIPSSLQGLVVSVHCHTQSAQMGDAPSQVSLSATPRGVARTVITIPVVRVVGESGSHYIFCSLDEGEGYVVSGSSSAAHVRIRTGRSVEDEEDEPVVETCDGQLPQVSTAKIITTKDPVSSGDSIHFAVRSTIPEDESCYPRVSVSCKRKGGDVSLCNYGDEVCEETTRSVQFSERNRIATDGGTDYLFQEVSVPVYNQGDTGEVFCSIEEGEGYTIDRRDSLESITVFGQAQVVGDAAVCYEGGVGPYWRLPTDNRWCTDGWSLGGDVVDADRPSGGIQTTFSWQCISETGEEPLACENVSSEKVLVRLGLEGDPTCPDYNLCAVEKEDGQQVYHVIIGVDDINPVVTIPLIVSSGAWDFVIRDIRVTCSLLRTGKEPAYFEEEITIPAREEVSQPSVHEIPLTEDFEATYNCYFAEAKKDDMYLQSGERVVTININGGYRSEEDNEIEQCWLTFMDPRDDPVFKKDFSVGVVDERDPNYLGGRSYLTTEGASDVYRAKKFEDGGTCNYIVNRCGTIADRIGSDERDCYTIDEIRKMVSYRVKSKDFVNKKAMCECEEGLEDGTCFSDNALNKYDLHKDFGSHGQRLKAQIVHEDKENKREFVGDYFSINSVNLYDKDGNSIGGDMSCKEFEYSYAKGYGEEVKKSYEFLGDDHDFTGRKPVVTRAIFDRLKINQLNNPFLHGFNEQIASYVVRSSGGQCSFRSIGGVSGQRFLPVGRDPRKSIFQCRDQGGFDPAFTSEFPSKIAYFSDTGSIVGQEGNLYAGDDLLMAVSFVDGGDGSDVRIACYDEVGNTLFDSIVIAEDKEAGNFFSVQFPEYYDTGSMEGGFAGEIKMPTFVGGEGGGKWKIGMSGYNVDWVVEGRSLRALIYKMMGNCEINDGHVVSSEAYRYAYLLGSLTYDSLLRNALIELYLRAEMYAKEGVPEGAKEGIPQMTGSLPIEFYDIVDNYIFNRSFQSNSCNSERNFGSCNLCRHYSSNPNFRTIAAVERSSHKHKEKPFYTSIFSRTNAFIFNINRSVLGIGDDEEKDVVCKLIPNGYHVYENKKQGMYSSLKFQLGKVTSYGSGGEFSSPETSTDLDLLIPRNFRYEATADSVTFEWEADDRASGSIITILTGTDSCKTVAEVPGEVVGEVLEEPHIDTKDTFTFEYEDLQPGVPHSFVVQSTTDTARSGSSECVPIPPPVDDVSTPACSEPAVPTNLRVIDHSTNYITFAWDADPLESYGRGKIEELRKELGMSPLINKGLILLFADPDRCVYLERHGGNTENLLPIINIEGNPQTITREEIGSSFDDIRTAQVILHSDSGGLFSNCLVLGGDHGRVGTGGIGSLRSGGCCENDACKEFRVGMEGELSCQDKQDSSVVCGIHSLNPDCDCCFDPVCRKWNDSADGPGIDCSKFENRDSCFIEGGAESSEGVSRWWTVGAAAKPVVSLEVPTDITVMGSRGDFLSDHPYGFSLSWEHDPDAVENVIHVYSTTLGRTSRKNCQDETNLLLEKTVSTPASSIAIASAKLEPNGGYHIRIKSLGENSESNFSECYRVVLGGTHTGGDEGGDIINGSAENVHFGQLKVSLNFDDTGYERVGALVGLYSDENCKYEYRSDEPVELDERNRLEHIFTRVQFGRAYYVKARSIHETGRYKDTNCIKMEAIERSIVEWSDPSEERTFSCYKEEGWVHEKRPK